MDKPFTVGLAIPLQGPGGLFGPGCEAVGQLAIEHLNAHHGILGREVSLRVFDAGRPSSQVAGDIARAVERSEIQALTGWHISSLRERLAPITRGRIPYVYTALHEGRPSAGVIHTGESPAIQVMPALHWLSRERGIRRWAIVGSDYVWPRATASAVRRHAAGGDFSVEYEQFAPYGTRDFRPVLQQIEGADIQGVLMLLVGRDAALFNRQFGAMGTGDECIRFSPLMEENTLLASGESGTNNLYSASGYFSALATAPAMDFSWAYQRRFGNTAPTLSSAAESCWEGILALAVAVSKAGRASMTAVNSAVEDGIVLAGPRGVVHLNLESAQQDIYLARADGYTFDIVGHLSSS